jgi:hypothetical protein
MVITLMAAAHARIASKTACNAVMEPPVTTVKMVMKAALSPVTPVQMVITMMPAYARNAATIVMFALQPPVQPVRLVASC